MTKQQDSTTVMEDTLKIAEAVRTHLAEKDCRHSIREIVSAALQLEAAEAQDSNKTAIGPTSPTAAPPAGQADESFQVVNQNNSTEIQHRES